MSRHLEIVNNQLVVVSDNGGVVIGSEEKITLKHAFRLAGMTFSSVKIYATARIEPEAMNYLLSMCREPTRPYNQEQ